MLQEYLKNIEDWHVRKVELLKSNQIIIFKYSPLCMTSFMIEKRFDKWAENLKDVKHISIVKVDVVGSRTLSQQISVDYNITHESPQVIWINEKDEVLWKGSHGEINENNLRKFLKK